MSLVDRQPSESTRSKLTLVACFRRRAEDVGGDHGVGGEDDEHRGQARREIASIAQVTGDGTRDLPPAVVNLVRSALATTKPELTSVLEGDKGRDLGTMGRMFGEELPAGLVFA